MMVDFAYYYLKCKFLRLVCEHLLGGPDFLYAAESRHMCIGLSFLHSFAALLDLKHFEERGYLVARDLEMTAALTVTHKTTRICI